MSYQLCAIICTHNPREKYLKRVIRALENQTLPLDYWELLVIDNASNESIANKFDISWHPNGRHIQEPELGLTPARLRGIAEAKAELLVFVDDDNVLASDYLANATKIGDEFPFIGAWGGTLEPEFEIAPANWKLPYLTGLVREVHRDQWSNNFDDWSSIPYGSGLCVRRIVAQKYSKEATIGTKRRQLGRTGKSLASAEDIDLVYTCRSLGMGWSVQSRLKLEHLIPELRCGEGYLQRLIYEGTISNLVLRDLWNLPNGKAPRKLSVVKQFIRLFLRDGWRAAQIDLARNRAMIDFVNRV